MRIYPVPHLTLDTRMCYREVSTGRYFHTYCMMYIQGKAMPASLREVGWRDPDCENCGGSIPGQCQLGIYRTVLEQERTTVEAEAAFQRRKQVEAWIDAWEAESEQQQA